MLEIQGIKNIITQLGGDIFAVKMSRSLQDKVLELLGKVAQEMDNLSQENARLKTQRIILADAPDSQYQKGKSTPQIQQVLSYLEKNGSITTNEAFHKLRINDLQAHIFTLKKKGYNIEGVNEKYKDGEVTHRFKTYYLKPK